MKLIRIAFAMAIAMCVASGLSFGQRQPNQRQNQRQQQRASMAMQSALDAIKAQSDPLQLIYRKDVQHDLGLDLGQRNKFDNLHDHQARDLQQTRVQNRRNPTAVTDLQKKQREETQGKIDELLTAAQKARLNEIVLQLQGNIVVLDPAMQKTLDITEEQKQSLAQIKEQRDSQIQQLQASVASGESVIQDIPTQLDQIKSQTDAAITEVLTGDQSEALKKLFGKPFKVGG